ncbi:MAG: hypothetical protein H0X11_10725 [Betaproteobacteria bacterium]|nr:hypothetical protein [Betaproteobacteria bacterium]
MTVAEPPGPDDRGIPYWLWSGDDYRRLRDANAERRKRTDDQSDQPPTVPVGEPRA